MNEVYSGSLTSLTASGLASLVGALRQPAFRAGQIFSWIHQKRVLSFDEMSNLPAAFRSQLAQAYTLDVPVVAQEQCSTDGTRKFLLRLADGNCVEAVLMQYHHGNSLCISSQVGCRMGCRFCASAQGGLVRNLTAGEMAGEVYTAMRHTGMDISHVVLMGIGEPLDNYDAVMDFISIITDAKGMNLSVRNLSLSTSGLVPEILKLAQKRLGITLSVSLHATQDETRSKMMPVNDAWPIEKLLAACREYRETTARRISFEYAMVRGVNDRPADAQRLAKLLRGMDAHVNLIPVNPVDGSPYGASDSKNVAAFRDQLQAFGLNATVRRRLGTDINAACGQLRQKAAAEAGMGEETDENCR